MNRSTESAVWERLTLEVSKGNLNPRLIALHCGDVGPKG